MTASTTTDRARLVDLALANGWEVVNMGQSWTEVRKGQHAVVLNWREDAFVELRGSAGNGYADLTLTDQAEVSQLLRGERQRDAITARYFEVVEPADGDLDNADYRETDRRHRFVQSAFIPQREVIVLASLARDARGLARVTGSRASTQVETVFGVELHVTWRRTA